MIFDSYDRDGDSWEPLACLEGSEELRKEYDKKNPASNKGSRIRVWAGNQYFVEAEPTESAAVSTPAKKDKKESEKLESLDWIYARTQSFFRIKD